MLKSLLRGLLGRPPEAAPGGQPVAVHAKAKDPLDEAYRMLQAGDNAGARALCEAHVLSHPQSVRAWEMLGAAAMNLGDDVAACDSFEQVLAVGGEQAQYLANAAEANRRADRNARALELIDRALALQPSEAGSLHIRVLAIEGCFRYEDALVACREALAQHPGFIKLHFTHLRLLNCAGAEPAQILDAHMRWAERFIGAGATKTAHTNSPEPERSLRIGYVSGDFRRHAVSDFVLPLLEHHDRAHFNVYCYSSTPRTDAVTARCEQLADHWRVISGMSDADAEALIRADGIDLLIDLSGHTAGNRLPLFARKPAPLQFTYLGYPGTTGIAQMDYRLTDAVVDPPGPSDASYREKLLRLPHSLWCYRPPDGMPEPQAAPCLHNGYVTFGSLNSVYKLNPVTIAFWSRLLRELPDSRMLMAGISSEDASARILDLFVQNGVEAGRITICPQMGLEEFLALHHRIDLALDSFPYNGGATTCATLWMGVPVLSLSGTLFQSRAGLSILHAIGLDELVADNREDLLRIALALARDAPRLAQLRDGMRARMAKSPLADTAGYTRSLETILRGAWREWCARR